MVKNQSQFTREQRMAIVTEFDNGTMSGAEIAQKYGLKYPSLIANWRKRLQKPPVYLQKSKKSCTFACGIQPQVADEEPMKKRTPEELEAEVKRLTKELEWVKLQNKALNTLIDIAEEQGIRIRKKSGAKQ